MPKVHRVCFFVDGEVFRTGILAEQDAAVHFAGEIRAAGKVVWIEEAELNWERSETLSPPYDFVTVGRV